MTEKTQKEILAERRKKIDEVGERASNPFKFPRPEMKPLDAGDFDKYILLEKAKMKQRRRERQ